MVHAVQLQALCGQLDRHEIGATDFVHRCARLISEAIGCSRTGIWLFDGHPTALRLRCLALYDADRDCIDVLPDETNEQVGAYFDALKRQGFVLAADVRKDPATAGLFGKALEARGIQSLMAVAMSVNGRLFGAFTCSHVHRQVCWTPQQLALLTRLGNRASLALAAATANQTLG